MEPAFRAGVNAAAIPIKILRQVRHPVKLGLAVALLVCLVPLSAQQSSRCAFCERDDHGAHSPIRGNAPGVQANFSLSAIFADETIRRYLPNS
jgi:hypothetical protein